VNLLYAGRLNCTDWQLLQQQRVQLQTATGAAAAAAAGRQDLQTQQQQQQQQLGPLVAQLGSTCGTHFLTWFQQQGSSCTAACKLA
jgi:hypothetical protein